LIGERAIHALDERHERAEGGDDLKCKSLIL
jgi:hypothetical protein